MENLKGMYLHFRGGEYEFLEVAKNCDNPEQEVVVYRSVSDGKIWVREFGEFFGDKVLEDGGRVKRFEKIGDKSGVVVKVQRLCDDAVVPQYSRAGDAGVDLHAIEDYILMPGERRLFKTGIAMELPEGYFASIRGRSGLAYKKGISVLGGVIEYTYRGDYGVILLNTGSESFEVRKGDRIAQVLFQPIASAEIEEVDSLSESVRGDGAFGSSGR